MRKLVLAVSVAALSVFSLTLVHASQQDKSKRPSPPAHAVCKLSNGKTVKIDYSSPRAKGRIIFGGLVPYGKIWRAGANEATTFVTDSDLTVGGASVPAGAYTIFTIPNEDKWTLVISKKTGEWGTAYPGEKEDLARIDMQAAKTSTPMEDFNIAFVPAGNGCTLQMEWETTRASVAISPK